MQLAILHYHLNRGGVTQVIFNHLEALATLPEEQRPTRVAVLYSGMRNGWPERGPGTLPFDLQLIAIPALEYDSTIGADPKALTADLKHALSEAGFQLQDTLFHAHNHSIGKNASLPGALANLATEAASVLLQIHDFAEDFRPANYRHLMKSVQAESAEALANYLYPQAEHIHYAALNGRDYDLLADSGVDTSRLHLLPNPVTEPRGLPEMMHAADVNQRVRAQLDLDGDARLIVYPVRGIRRKNLGEMLLHAALAGPPEEGGACYALTLAPENPAERVSYDRWCELAEELDLPCRFDIGDAGGVAFGDALAAADAIITTSVAEGFGMVFLETCLADRPLVGRDLPGITRDFVDNGLRFPGLAPEVRVPMAWIDRDVVREHLLELHRWTCRDFGIESTENEDEQLESLFADDSIDFAVLPTPVQADVIRKVAADRKAAREAMDAYHPTGDVLSLRTLADQNEIVAENARLVHEKYSPAAIGERLASVYQNVLASEASPKISPPPHGAAVLDAFLRIDRLHPVRIEA